MQTAAGLFAEDETHKVDLSSLSNKLLPGLTTLGFKDDRRHKGMSTSAFIFVPFVARQFNFYPLKNKCQRHSECFFT